MNLKKSGGRSYAIWHDGALGDLLISLPAMDLIRRVSSGIHTFIARGEPGRFVGGLLKPHSFLPSDSPELISIFYGKMPRPLCCVEKVVLFTRNPKGDIALGLSRLFGNGLVIIDTSPRRMGTHGDTVSLYEQEFSQVKQILGGNGGGFLSYVPGKNPSHTEAYWVLHPGSGGIEKCWPIPCFEALVHGLRKRFPTLAVKIILGPAERHRSDEFARLFEAAREQAIVDASLERVFEVLGAAKFYVGNDSGISHLAALSRRESFIIFGPTEPAIWAPPFPWVHTIARTQPCAIGEIQAEEVLKEIIKTIST